MIRALLLVPLLAPLLLLPACGADGDPRAPGPAPARDVISSGTISSDVISSGNIDGADIEEDNISGANTRPG